MRCTAVGSAVREADMSEATGSIIRQQAVILIASPPGIARQ